MNADTARRVTLAMIVVTMIAATVMIVLLGLITARAVASEGWRAAPAVVAFAAAVMTFLFVLWETPEVWRGFRNG